MQLSAGFFHGTPVKKTESIIAVKEKYLIFAMELEYLI